MQERTNLLLSLAVNLGFGNALFEGQVYTGERYEFLLVLWQYLFYQLQSPIKRFFCLEPDAISYFQHSDCDYFRKLFYYFVLSTLTLVFAACRCISSYPGGFRSVDVVDILRISHLYSISLDRVIYQGQKKQVLLNICLWRWILRINRSWWGFCPLWYT